MGNARDERKANAIKHHELMNACYRAATSESIKNSKVYRNVNFDIASSGTSKIKVIDGTTESVVKLLFNHCCILNFASFTRAGGGFLGGSIAQEEALCHVSNLYEILSSFQDSEYNLNYEKYQRGGLYTDWAIFTPNVKFVFSKEEKDVDVITCACPNWKRYKTAYKRDDALFQETLKKRIKYILDIAEDNKVENLVLGAFGCGVFENDPSLVATLFKEELKNRNFKEVVFAIPNDKRNKNYISFAKVFEQD